MSWKWLSSKADGLDKYTLYKREGDNLYKFVEIVDNNKKVEGKYRVCLTEVDMNKLSEKEINDYIGEYDYYYEDGKIERDGNFVPDLGVEDEILVASIISLVKAERGYGELLFEVDDLGSAEDYVVNFLEYKNR